MNQPISTVMAFLVGYQLLFYLHLLYINDIALIPNPLARCLDHCIPVEHNWMVNGLYLSGLIRYQYDKITRFIERFK